MFPPLVRPRYGCHFDSVMKLHLFSITLYVYLSFLYNVHAQLGLRYCPDMPAVRITGKNSFYTRQLINVPLNNSSVAQNLAKCEKYLFYRSYTGECTHPTRPYIGRSGTPLFSYYKNFDATNMTGSDLKSAREVSNIVFHQLSEDMIDYKYRLSEFTTFFGQFLDHSIVLSSTDSSSSARRDIPVPMNDISMLSSIHFNRNVRANKKGASKNRGWTRAINILPSAVDLFGVYGTEELSDFLRLKKGGFMREYSGSSRLLPLNDGDFNTLFSKMNAPKVTDPNDRKKFFLAGDARSNENPQLTAFHTLWMRNHNFIATKLAWDFQEKKTDDEWLFNNARRINQAQFQFIVYNEYLPRMIGDKLPECENEQDCFLQNENCGISDIFANAAFRVGHTMVGNKVHRIGAGRIYMEPLRLSDAFFPTKDLIMNDGIEPYLRGAIWNPAQKVDNEIGEALRLKLFENTPGEDGVDLVALNIQRGRDTNLPTFAKIKKDFTGKRVKSFKDISKDKGIIRVLTEAYGTVDKVELFPGLLCEDHKPGAPMGPTLVAIWKREFERLRAGDNYFYRNLFRYHEDIRGHSLVQDLVNDKGPTMRDILINNTDINDSDLPPRAIWDCDYTCKISNS